MFFSSIGLALMLLSLVAARLCKVEEMTLGWRVALWGSTAFFLGGFFIDEQTAGLLHWCGREGLLLAVGGDALMWGMVALLVIWVALRAATRLRRDSDAEPEKAPLFRAGSRLDIVVILVAGVALQRVIPDFLSDVEKTRLDLAAPPVVEQVTFKMIHVYEEKVGRLNVSRREAVFAKENGEEEAIPMPVSKRFDELDKLRTVTREGAAGTKVELTYHPRGRSVVSIRAL